MLRCGYDDGGDVRTLLYGRALHVRHRVRFRGRDQDILLQGL